MESLTYWNTGFFTTILTFIATIFCFYFTLSFFEHLKSGNENLMKKAKRAAVVSLAITLAIPALNTLYNLFLMNQFME